jgi:hypothetical protein
MKTWYLAFVVMVLAGCATSATTSAPTVPPTEIVEFIEIVESKDYHRMAQQGKETFQKGLYIPNHADLLAQFPASEPQQDYIRYVLYSFRGEASAGEVYLILEQATGRIIEFNHIEVWTAGAPHLRIETDKRVYAVGDSVLVTVRNNLQEPISYFDGCPLRLCQYVDGEWPCEWKECHGSTVVLAPDGSLEMKDKARTPIGTRLRYEFDYQIVSEGTSHTACSNEFTVE